MHSKRVKFRAMETKDTITVGADRSSQFIGEDVGHLSGEAAQSDLSWCQCINYGNLNYVNLRNLHIENRLRGETAVIFRLLEMYFIYLFIDFSSDIPKNSQNGRVK